VPPAVSPPRDEAELLGRACQLAGLTLRELARCILQPLPTDPRRAKGWIGLAVEKALGAQGASRAVPDFPDLGVELKTLPVDRRGRPRESTFVCTIDLSDIGDTEWYASRVCRKLSRVLWVPVESQPGVLFSDRRLGQPLLWSPSRAEQDDLRFDWEELSGMIGRGELDRVTGHLGKSLQIRPKAAHSRARRRYLDDKGVPRRALPRGFYLRPSFTERVLRSAFFVAEQK
jgi:DNA mismatch repair protein MutH